METGPDAGIGNLFGEGRHVGPTVSYAGCRRTGYRDLGDVGGPEHRLDGTRDGAALDTVRARVFRVHRRIGDRLPSCVTIGGRVAIDIAVANGRDRSPKIVVILGIQYCDDRVGDPN